MGGFANRLQLGVVNLEGQMEWQQYLHKLATNYSTMSRPTGMSLGVT